MEKVQKFNAGVHRFTQAIALISFVCVLFMMLMNVADVIMGYLFQTHILGAYELTQRMLMCAVFTAFAYGQSKKSHINMTIIIVHFPRPLRFIIFTLMGILSVLAAGAMTYAAAVQTGVAINTGYMTEVLYIPLWPFYVIETAAMGIFTLALIYDTILSVIAIFREDYAQMIQADWS
ncbi:MAG: TRAP transporter small permease [Oscillospiraceae bacterium]|nr:TRAP transporter small permease [Oscillospiraceae bacterium]